MEAGLPAMKRLALPMRLGPAAALAATLWLVPQAAMAQSESPTASRGENFSDKPPAQLFASDCTGAGCHKSPQGLAKGRFLGGLAGFLREHYTNSRESAAALARYLAKLPPEPKERERETRSRRGAPGSGERAGFSPPGESRSSRQPSSRGPRSPAPHEEEEKPAAARSHPPAEKPSRAPPSGHAAAASAAATPPEAVPTPPPAPAPQIEAAPPPEPPPAPAPEPPKKKTFDIFD
jgi:hypothetical protein